MASTQPDTFVENFWGSDFLSTTGYDRITQRMKHSKQTLTDYIEFIKKRSQIELRYGKDMIQLANSVLGKDEIGTMHSSLEILQRETMDIGKNAMQGSQLLAENIGAEIREFRDKQREERRGQEDIVSKSNRSKKSSFDHMLRCKNAYEKACMEADKSAEILQQNMTQPSKKVEDLKTKMKKAKSSAENADKEYQESVSVLETARQSWERDYATYCKRMQLLEEDRINTLRNMIWKYTNICSQCLVDMDNRYEQVRRTLEHCDIKHDINLFIREHKTGKARPASIPYENYYNSNVRIEDEMKKNSLPKGSNPIQDYERAVAMYEYAAQGPEELNLAQGDLLVVIQKVDELWWYGKHKNGKTGMFPVSYVRVMPM